MKAKFATLIVCSQVLLMLACHKSHDDVNVSQNQPVTNGDWRVTLFTDSGNDETVDFNNYTFYFSSEGTLKAVRNGTTTIGSWSKGSKFNIDLGVKNEANKPLGELTDDWQIISISPTEIRLGDDNPASGELLTFTKN